MDLKIEDVAELLSVSEATIRRWLSEGKIPAYWMNDQYRFSRMEIENWMVACKLKGQDDTFSFAQEEGCAKGGLNSFCLYRAIHQGDVFSDIPGKTKEELIRGTTRLISQKLNVDAEVLSELLIDREEMMPTSLNHGIAVPHTRDFLRKGPLDMVFVVYPESPIDYGALDAQPVHTLFFLFAGNDKGHLQLLAKLAHLSGNPTLREFLIGKPNKKVLLEMLRSWESVLYRT